MPVTNPLNAESKKTTVYLIRHGETDYNRRMIVQGRRIDSDLNDTGLEQARALAERFQSIPLDVIYTSTLKRAVQTGEVVSRLHPGVRVFRDADLEEMSWGIYEGMELSPEVYEAFRNLRRQWDKGVFGVRVEEGESILEVQARALKSFERIVNRHRGERVLVITHGRLMRVLLASVLPGYDLRRMHEIEHINTAVNIIECIDDGYEASLLNCTAHLTEVEVLSTE